MAIPTLEYPGIKYPGRRAVAEVFDEVKRQAQVFQDYMLLSRSLRLVKNDKYGLALSFTADGEVHQLPMTQHVYMQLCNWIGLPTNSKLYKYLRYGLSEYKPSKGPVIASDRFWSTWCTLVNDFFGNIAATRLIRTIQDHDGTWYVRAFLSNQYLVIPNDQLFLAVCDELQNCNAEPWDARLSENSFYLYAVAPGISAQVRKDRAFDDGARWLGDKDDSVNAALMISNSETGQGGCEVCPAILTKVSGAYFVKQNALSRKHIGSRHAMDGLLSTETIRKRNSIFFDEVKDYVKAVFDEESFQLFVDKLNDATQDEIEDPLTAAKAVRAIYELSEAREASIIKWLMRSGDRSRYGLATAIATEAHDNTSMDPSEAVKLEQISVDLVENKTVLGLARAYKSVAEKDAAKAARKADKATFVATAPDYLEL